MCDLSVFRKTDGINVMGQSETGTAGTNRQGWEPGSTFPLTLLPTQE